MKKSLQLLVVLGLMLSIVGCSKTSSKDTLVVGSETFGGYFLPSEGLSNGAADETIRELLHGGGLVEVNETGELEVNQSVVKDSKRVEHADGSVSYTITLQDMLWSDGEAITSDDYIFGLLLAASPAYGEAGALDATGEGLIGYWDYYDGSTDVFQGIKRINEKSFQLEIDVESLPYFWELVYVSVAPYPMHALVGDKEQIISNEEGSTFDGDMAKAVDTFITTYNEAQSPSCGPYTLEKFENGQVSLKINDNYSGNLNGKKPSIKNIIVKEVSFDTAMDALIAKEIDILEPILEKSVIDAGLKAEKDGALQAVKYPRNGYGVFATKDDVGATHEAEVRRGLAYLLDREALANDIMGSDGSILDSDYALDQWMVKETKDLKLPYAYAFSIQKANGQFDASSYHFEADGVTPWDVNKVRDDYYRYNARQEVLEIRHLATDSNSVSDLVEHQMMSNAIKVGVKYSMDRTDEAGLQEAYYFSSENGEVTSYNAFTLGSEFASIPDPYYASISCDYVGTSANPSNYCDVRMDELIDTMRHTDQNDKQAFLEAWQEYIAYFNEALPQIPLYTSMYYGFANADIKGYEPNAYMDWASQIATMSWK